MRFMHLTSGLDVIVERDAEGSYFALVPAIPGCGSQGDSVADVLENLDDALMVVLEVMHQDDPERLLELCGARTRVAPSADPAEESTTGGTWYGVSLGELA